MAEHQCIVKVFEMGNDVDGDVRSVLSGLEEPLDTNINFFIVHNLWLFNLDLSYSFGFLRFLLSISSTNVRRVAFIVLIIDLAGGGVFPDPLQEFRKTLSVDLLHFEVIFDFDFILDVKIFPLAELEFLVEQPVIINLSENGVIRLVDWVL